MMAPLTSWLAASACLVGQVLSTPASRAVNEPSSFTGNASYAWDQLAISAPSDGRYLYRTRTDEPFLWMADTNWELFHRLNKTDVDLYLADRAAKGFNVVMAVALSKYEFTVIPNFYGETPYSSLYSPTEEYWAYVDWVIERAAEYGILIAMIPVWGRYVNCGWYGGPVLFDEQSMEYWGRYLGARYPGIPKLLGGDSNAFSTCNMPVARATWRQNQTLDPAGLIGPIEDVRPLWSAMMSGFKASEAEKGYDAFVVFHPTSPWISTEGQPKPYGHNYINGSYGTLSMDAVQSGHESPDPEGLDAGFTVFTPWDSTKNYENIIEMRSEFSGPVIDLENHYEGAHDAFNESKPIWSASIVRHGLYSAVFSGAAGYVYGSLPVQQSYEPKERLARPELYYPAQLGLAANESWHEGLHLPGASQAGYMSKLFKGLDRETFDSMTPDRSIITSTEVLEYESNRYVAALRAADRYLVYVGYGDAFNLDLSALAVEWNSTQATSRWFNPRTGIYSDETSGVLTLSGTKTFTPSTSGSEDYDWVLELKVEQ